jgi:hypothetical protein
MPALKWIAVAAALVLAACGGAQQRYGAAEGVRDFFAAVQSGDKQAFEARIDRDALRESLKTQLRASAGGGQDALLGRLLKGDGADRLLDAMITPESFKLVAERSGAPMTRTPTAAEIAVLLRLDGEDRACLRAPGQETCLMTFRLEDGVWKLVELKGSQVQMRASDSAAG